MLRPRPLPPRTKQMVRLLLQLNRTVNRIQAHMRSLDRVTARLRVLNEVFLLYYLDLEYPGNLTQAQLEDRLGLDLSSISRLLAGLERQGYVKGRWYPPGARDNPVPWTITPGGRRRLRKTADAVGADVLRELTWLCSELGSIVPESSDQPRR